MITRRVPLRYTKAFREQDGAHGAFEAEVRAAGMVPRVATATTASRAAWLVVRTRVMYADDEPVQVATTTIPWDIGMASELDLADTGTGGIMSRLTDAGYAPVRFTETVTPYRRPARGLEEALHCGPEPDGCWDPVMEIVHCAYAHDGTLIERTVCVMPCHLWTLEYSWEGDEKQ